MEDHAAAVERARHAGEPEPPQPTLALRMLAVGPSYSEPPLSNSSFHLARWFIHHLAEDAAVDWVTGLARSGRRPHRRLRDLIRRTLHDPNFNLPASKRRFWRLVSSESPWMAGGPGADYIWDLPDLLREPGSDELFQVELAAVRNVSTTLIHPGSAFRLGSSALTPVD